MNTINTSTGYSGFQLHLGCSPHVILPLMPDNVPEDVSDAHNTAINLLQCVNTDVCNAHDNLLLAKVTQSHYTSANQASWRLCNATHHKLSTQIQEKM
jgi:hypothetical protein